MKSIIKADDYYYYRRQSHRHEHINHSLQAKLANISIKQVTGAETKDKLLLTIHSPFLCGTHVHMARDPQDGRRSSFVSFSFILLFSLSDFSLSPQFFDPYLIFHFLQVLCLSVITSASCRKLSVCVRELWEFYADR